MSTEQNVYLIGPMGVGKTTIGKSLARQLRLEFVDADQEIEKHTGVSIATIFDIEGEEAFRVREKTMIEKLTTRRGIVLATDTIFGVFPYFKSADVTPSYKFDRIIPFPDI